MTLNLLKVKSGVVQVGQVYAFLILEGLVYLKLMGKYVTI